MREKLISMLFYCEKKTLHRWFQANRTTVCTMAVYKSRNQQLIASSTCTLLPCRFLSLSDNKGGDKPFFKATNSGHQPYSYMWNLLSTQITLLKKRLSQHLILTKPFFFLYMSRVYDYYRIWPVTNNRLQMHHLYYGISTSRCKCPPPFSSFFTVI